MKVDIYCDESRLEFLESKTEKGFMVIGSLWLLREKRDDIKSKIKEVKQKHSFNVEIKWTKIQERLRRKTITQCLNLQKGKSSLTQECNW